MSETVMHVNTLPEVLLSLIHTEQVKLFNNDGVIVLFPIPSDQDLKHPLELTREELIAKLDRGLADIEAGRTRPVEEVFAELRQKHAQRYSV